ncbi:hypothetical protein B0H19DRAFT_973755, partial [Mycena capillaripes]
GAFVDIFLGGILCAQLASYHNYYKDDKMGLKIVVFVLGMMQGLKSLQSLAGIWELTVTNAGDLAGAQNVMNFAWYAFSTTLVVAICGLYVQGYYVFRLYVICKKWLVVVPVAIAMAVSFIAACVAVRLPYKMRNNLMIRCLFSAVITHLACVFVADLLICVFSVFFLLRSKNNALPQTKGLVSALIRLAFQSAAPAATCALINMVLVLPGILPPNNNTEIAFNLMIPKLYAVSMMYTINARRRLRLAHGSGQVSSSTEATTGRRGAIGFSTRAHRENVELSHIQIRTTREISQKVNVSVFFSSHSSFSG